jgi:glycosyltransferase involved in cell wall biosynthesis
LPGRALILVENLSVPFDRRVWQEASTLRDHGWDVEVICPLGEDRDTEREAVVDGVAIHRYPLQAATGGPQGYLKEYTAALLHSIRLALAITRRAPVDVVHLCNPPDLLFVVALVLKVVSARRHRTRTRVVFDQHDLVPELYLSRFRPKRDALYWGLRLVEFLTYRSADVVISTNESYRAKAVGRGWVRGSRAFTVRSAPALDRFKQVPPEPELARGREHLLVYLGVMGPQDGVDYAVRALARLAEERDDWHAAFLGGGDAFDDVVDLTHRLGLDDRVTFTGMADTPDVRRYLSTACVGIAPDPLNPLNDVSTMNKIMEYMAMGLPMVSFDLTESRVSAGDAALFARPNDVDEYATLISELLDDPVRRKQMGEVGRERVAGTLSWSHSQQSLLAAYATVDPAPAVGPVPSIEPARSTPDPAPAGRPATSAVNDR